MISREQIEERYLKCFSCKDELSDNQIIYSILCAMKDNHFYYTEVFKENTQRSGTHKRINFCIKCFEEIAGSQYMME